MDLNRNAMSWSLAFITTLAALAVIGCSKRLPRSFTPTHYCSACHAIAFQFSEVYTSVPEDGTVDSGSFRLSESGKQKGLQKVPIRQTELHAGYVLEETCKDIQSNWVIFEGIAPSIFVPAAMVREQGLDINATSDSKPLRSLREVCSGLLDDHYDELVSLIKTKPLTETDFLGDAAVLCDGVTGIFRACTTDAEELFIDVLAEARRQAALQKAADSSKTVKENMESDGGDSMHGNSSELGPEKAAVDEAVDTISGSDTNAAGVAEGEIESRDEL